MAGGDGLVTATTTTSSSSSSTPHTNNVTRRCISADHPIDLVTRRMGHLGLQDIDNFSLSYISWCGVGIVGRGLCRNGGKTFQGTCPFGQLGMLFQVIIETAGRRFGMQK